MRLILCMFLALACSKHGAPTKGESGATGFTGTFRGAISGTAATLSARQQGTHVTGTIDASGYGYTFDGTVDGTRASGTLTDPQTNATLSFEATLSAGDLAFVIVAPNGQRMPVSFQREGATGASGTAATAPTKRNAASTGTGDHDPRLVGSWQYTEQLGDPLTGTMLTVWHLVVQPDGTYVYGTDTSQQRGHWRTRGNVVEVSEDGASWEPYARFTVEGNRALFTFADGSRKLWHRN